VVLLAGGIYVGVKRYRNWKIKTYLSFLC
jgi:hypothetical protein